MKHVTKSTTNEQNNARCLNVGIHGCRYALETMEGLRLSSEEAEAFHKDCDINGDGLVTLDEFTNAVVARSLSHLFCIFSHLS